jgi:putative radical SAM enzyme (TIGR03279 family)
VKIKSVEKGSLAEKCSIISGEEILEINKSPIKDFIDYKFYSSDEILNLRIKDKSGRIRGIWIIKKTDQDLGISFEEKRYRGCGNKCIFCFVHQLPRGLRKALYFKDEDYRLSFLHGNFITLTNLSEQDIQRIIDQRLSPLYVSVHGTDEALRKRILGNPKAPDILPLIRRLTENRIELHTQIVLCPEVNDGHYLEKTVYDLSLFYPRVKSLAIVPVGLTKFRKGLTPLKTVNKEYSRKLIKSVDHWQSYFRRKYKSNFVYLADEFYLLAGLDIPPKKYYDEFYQIENGVGMVREFLDNFQRKQRTLPQSIKSKSGLTLVTGTLANRFLKNHVLNRLKRIKNLKINLIPVKNDFLGESVTVSGLLTGRDILRTLKKSKHGESVMLPPNCLNSDGLFLDDLKPLDLEKELSVRVVTGSYDIAGSLLKTLQTQTPGV